MFYADSGLDIVNASAWRQNYHPPEFSNQADLIDLGTMPGQVPGMTTVVVARKGEYREMNGLVLAGKKKAPATAGPWARFLALLGIRK